MANYNSSHTGAQIDAAVTEALALVGQTGAYANFKISEEGGVMFKLTNKTGAASIKGQAINFSPDYDMSYIAATDAYTVNGFVYEAGKADGSETWIVRDGIAEVLLVDGYAAGRNAWVRLSPTVAGRCITQVLPGLTYPATSLAYDSANGTTAAGALGDIQLDNGVKLQINGTTIAPSIDARFTFTGVDSQPNELYFNGYFSGTGTALLQIWDYVEGGGSWVTAASLTNAAADATSTFTGITANMLSTGEMRVRLFSNSTSSADKFYVDTLILRSTAAGEHFKEVGHVTTAAASGTDVLAKINIHLL